MSFSALPSNLKLLHQGEEDLRLKSAQLIGADQALLLHLHAVEGAMDMLDVLRQVPTEDEDLKVILVLGMRVFNAFASSLKLILSGYYQHGAMIMRDILETVFLLDLFRTDRPAITRWRLADKKMRKKDFKPVVVREALDKRDGFTTKKRALMYELFSELASHPSMESISMLRPKGMDARNGPFVDPTALEATLSEMGRLAVQTGEKVEAFFPPDWRQADATRLSFMRYKKAWITEFYSPSSRE